VTSEFSAAGASQNLRDACCLRRRSRLPSNLNDPASRRGRSHPPGPCCLLRHQPCRAPGSRDCVRRRVVGAAAASSSPSAPATTISLLDDAAPVLRDGISAEISVSGSHGMDTTITSATCTMTTRDVKTYTGNTSGTIQQASLTYGFAGGANSRRPVVVPDPRSARGPLADARKRKLWAGSGDGHDHLEPGAGAM